MNMKTILLILGAAVVVGLIVAVVKTAGVINSAFNAVIAIVVILALVIIVIWMFWYARRR